jgi:sugar lactone lactonase YvrE
MRASPGNAEGNVREGSEMPHRWRIRLVLLTAVIAALAMAVRRQTARADSGIAALPDPYGPAESFGKLPPGRPWGSTSAVAIDSQGHVWVGERCGKNSCGDSPWDSILEFDSSGKLLKSFGGGLLAVPHSLYFDKSGNLWVTDSGELRLPSDPAPAPGAHETKGHVAIKFSPEGKILMTLGKPGVVGDGTDTFHEPNAVVEGAHGDLFVADGHIPHKGGARIMKFTKDGRFIKQWGSLGTAPGQFDVPHALAFDSRGRLFVADRANKRIQIFDQDGNFLEEWKQFGSPSGIFIDSHDVIYVSDSQSESADPKAERYNPGFEHGVRVGSAKDGTVTANIPMQPPPKADNAPEGITADPMGNIYIAETIVQGVWKYSKK